MKIKDIKLAKTVFDKKDIINDDLTKILFMGRSNVGKSSLINSLLARKKLAKISSKPGKTVSINYYLINNRFYFVDLPGYGFAKISKQENQRVKSLLATFFENVSQVALVLILIDSRRGFMESDIDLLSKIVEKNFNILTILTKSDKISSSQLKSQIKQFQDQFDLLVIPFSIKASHDKEKILKYIEEAII
jgi:GTP-binding protein